MKSDALFNDIRSKKNIKILEAQPEIRVKFQSKYYNLQDKLFFEVMENCGGIKKVTSIVRGLFDKEKDSIEEFSASLY